MSIVNSGNLRSALSIDSKLLNERSIQRTSAKLATFAEKKASTRVRNAETQMGIITAYTLFQSNVETIQSGELVVAQAQRGDCFRDFHRSCKGSYGGCERTNCTTF